MFILMILYNSDLLSVFDVLLFGCDFLYVINNKLEECYVIFYKVIME